ncbi:MAG: hypothetical protein WDN31_04770 [Hyphomicrobium sp.]
MTELLWQATLLLARRFFFGAVLACCLKRRFYYGRSGRAPEVAVSGIAHAPAPGQPRIEVAPRVAAEGERFNRAIAGQTVPAAAPAPTAHRSRRPRQFRHRRHPPARPAAPAAAACGDGTAVADRAGRPGRVSAGR